MKLDPDCVRELMLFFEERTSVDIRYDNGHKISCFHALAPVLISKMEPLTSYSFETILYHIVQLSESGYIVTDFNLPSDNNIGYFKLSRIYYITPKGHELIASIKEDGRWGKIKKILNPIGGVSLAIIESVSSGVTSAMIQKITNQG